MSSERITWTFSDEKALDDWPISSEFDVLIGTELRSLRQQAGLSLEQMSKEIGKSVSFVSFYERGIQGLTLIQFCTACAFLSVHPSRVLRDTLKTYFSEMKKAKK